MAEDLDRTLPVDRIVDLIRGQLRDMGMVVDIPEWAFMEGTEVMVMATTTVDMDIQVIQEAVA